METHSSKELRHFRFISVSFMAQLLGSQRFIGKVSAASESFIKPQLNPDSTSSDTQELSELNSCRTRIRPETVTQTAGQTLITLIKS